MMAATPTSTPATPSVSGTIGQILSGIGWKMIAVIVVLWIASTVLESRKKQKRGRRQSSRRTERSMTRSAPPRYTNRTMRKAQRKSKAPTTPDAPPAPDPVSVERLQAMWNAPAAPNDLAVQSAGATLRSVGAGDEASPWTVGAVGEETTAQRLAELGDGWRVVHSVPVGKHGSDLDHLVIGPPGVFVLNSKMRAGADVKVINNGIRVAGVWERYLHASRHEADRVRATLAKRRFEVPVIPAIVFVGVKSLSVGEERPDVAVLSVNDVVWWLRGQPTSLGPEQIEALYEVVRQRSTWQ